MADNFTVVANDTDIRKQSLPFVVYVDITPINDESPIITVNRILKVNVLKFTIVCTLHTYNLRNKGTSAFTVAVHTY